YGFLANPQRQEKLEQCRQLLGMPPTRESSSDPATLEDYRDRYERLTGRSLLECPVCHRGHMIPVANLPGVDSSPVVEDTSLSSPRDSPSTSPGARSLRVNGLVLSP